MARLPLQSAAVDAVDHDEIAKRQWLHNLNEDVEKARDGADAATRARVEAEAIQGRVDADVERLGNQPNDPEGRYRPLDQYRPASPEELRDWDGRSSGAPEIGGQGGPKEDLTEADIVYLRDLWAQRDEDARSMQARGTLVNQVEPPDAVAEDRRLAGDLGVNPAEVGVDREAARRRLTANRVDEYVKTAPRLRTWLDDPENLSISHDDLENLSWWENAAKEIAKGTGTLSWREAGQAAGNILPSMERMALGFDMMVFDTLSEAGLGDFSDWWKGSIERGAGREYESEFLRLGEEIAARTPQGDSWIESGIYDAIQSSGASVSAVIASVLTGNPYVGVFLLGAGTAGESYGRASVEHDKDFLQSMRYALTQGGIETATELLPMKWLVGDIVAGTGFGKMLAKNMVAGGVGEQIAAATQDLSTWLELNPEKTFGDYLAERPEAQFRTLVASTLMSAVQTTAAKGVDEARLRLDAAERQRRSEQLEKTFEALGSAAKDSKLLKRLPEKFREFVNEATKDGPLESVRVTPEAVVTLAQSNNLSIEQLAQAFRIDPADMERAISSGEDIVIPTGNYAAVMGGGKKELGVSGETIHAALAPHMRLKADDFTADERDAMQKVFEEEQAARQESAGADEAFADAGDRVRASIREAVRGLGVYNATTADANAEVLGAMAVTLAEQTNQDPEAVWKEHGYDLAVGEGVTVEGDALAQTAVSERMQRVITLRAQGMKPAQIAREVYPDRDPKRALMSVYAAGQVYRGQIAAERAKYLEANPPAAPVEKAADLAKALGIPQPRGEYESGDLVLMYNDGLSNVEMAAELSLYGPDVSVNGLGIAQTRLRNFLKDAQSDPEKFKAISEAVRVTPDELTAFMEGSVRAAKSRQSDATQRIIELKARGMSNEDIARRVYPDVDTDTGKNRVKVLASKNKAEIEALREDAAVLAQKERGQFSKRNGERSVITLFESADPSTLMHEGAHWYLDTLLKMSKAENPHPFVLDQLAATKEWRGLHPEWDNMFDANGQFTTEGRELQEAFAETFVAYLREGKAPSISLRAVFASFKAWLIRLYKSVQKIGSRVNLNPEITAVFDRMLATDDAIKAASASMDRDADAMAKALLDRKVITERQYERTRERLRAARERAEADMLARLMDEYERNQKAWWRQEERKTSIEVTREVDARPEQRAFAWLTGKGWRGAEVRPQGDALTLAQAEYRARLLDRMGFYSAAQEVALQIPENVWKQGWQAARSALAKGYGGVAPKKAELEYLGLDAMFGDSKLKGAELRDAVVEHVAAGRLELVERYNRFDPATDEPHDQAERIADLDQQIDQRRAVLRALTRSYPDDPPSVQAATHEQQDELDRLLNERDVIFFARRDPFALAGIRKGPGETRLPGQEPVFEWRALIPQGDPGADFKSHWSRDPSNDDGVLVSVRGEERLDDKGQQTLFGGEVQSDMGSFLRNFREKKDGKLVWIKEAEFADQNLANMNEVPLAGDTSTWTNVAVRAMVFRAARDGFDSVSFPTAETSALIQGNESASQHYETNVKPALEKIAKQLGGEVRNGAVRVEGVSSKRELKTGETLEPLLDPEEFGEPSIQASAYVMDLTPEMKARILSEGFALFQSGDDTAFDFLDNMVENPSARGVERFQKKLLQAGRGGVVRLIRSPDGKLIAFDGYSYTHDDAIKVLGLPADSARALVEFGQTLDTVRWYDDGGSDLAQSGDLPMDEASRMQRAREQGFDVDTPLYRGVSGDHDIRPYSMWTTDPAEASAYASGSALTNSGKNANVIPAYMKSSKNGRNIDDEIMEALENGDDPDAIARQVIDAEGLDWVEFMHPSAVSQDDHIVRVIKDPSNIRGKFAKFDPSKTDSPRLLAQSGDGGDIAPPPTLPPMRLDLRAVEENHGPEALEALPPEVRAYSSSASDVDGFVQIARATRRSQNKRKPKSLAKFITSPRKIGGMTYKGLRDEGGEIMTMIGSKGAFPGLIAEKAKDSKTVKSYDVHDAAVAAWEEGYFAEVPDDNQFLVALSRDVSGQAPLYSQNDADAVSELVAAEQWAEWFEQQGVDISAPVDELREALTKVLSAESDGAISPDDAAPFFGMQTGQELLDGLRQGPMRDKIIKAETERRMIQQHGDIYRDGTMAVEAEKFARNELRGRQLEIELDALSRATGKIAASNLAKETARERLRDKQVREVLNYTQWLHLEQRWGRKAYEAAGKGDFAKAEEYKRYQLLNYHMYREAMKLAETVEKARKHLLAYETKPRQARLHAAGKDYANQMNGLLDDYVLRPESRRGERNRLGRSEWIKAQMASIDPYAAYADQTRTPEEREIAAEEMVERSAMLRRLAEGADAANYKSLTVADFLAVRDEADMIWKLATMKDKLLKEGERRRLSLAAADIAEEIVTNQPNEKPPEPIETDAFGEDLKRGVLKYFAMHRTLQSLAHQFAGGKDNGVFWRYIVRPLNEAFARAAGLRIKMGEDVKQLFSVYTGAEQGRFYRARQNFPAIGRSLTMQGRLAVALNWGNEKNRKRLMDSMGWNEAQVKTVLDSLDKRDWDFLQSAWDYLDTWYPEANRVHENVHGAPMDKVEPLEIVTRHGIYRGGYYPIKFDPNLSSKTKQLDAEADAKASAGRVGVKTAPNFSNKRVEGKVTKPLRLSAFDVITQHLDEVATSIATEEAMLDAGRLVMRPEVEAAIVERYGRQIYNTIVNTLVTAKHGMQGANGMLAHLRNGSTIVGLGLNVGTALLQPFGMANSVARVGASWMVLGLARNMGPLGFDAVAMQSSAKFIADRSEYMRTRRQAMSPEIAAMRGKVKGSVTPTWLTGTAFWLLGNVQYYTVDMPTWYAVWLKAEAAGLDEDARVAVADQAVIDAQGGGELHQTSAMQTGAGTKYGAALRLLTNFMSYMITTYNLTMQRTGNTDFKDAGQVALLARDVVLMMSMGVAATMVVGAIRGSDDDSDKELWERWMREQIAFSLSPFVGISQFAGAARGDDAYAYRGPAGLGFFGEMSRAGQAAAEGDFDESFWRPMNKAAGTLFHYPASQLDRTVRGSWALWNGETDDPKAIFFGPPPE